MINEEFEWLKTLHNEYSFKVLTKMDDDSKYDLFVSEDYHFIDKSSYKSIPINSIVFILYNGTTLQTYLMTDSYSGFDNTLYDSFNAGIQIKFFSYLVWDYIDITDVYKKSGYVYFTTNNVHELNYDGRRTLLRCQFFVNCCKMQLHQMFGMFK